MVPINYGGSLLNILFMMVVYIWLMYSMHLISCLLPMQRRSTSGAGVIASGLGLLVPPVRINIFVCSLTFFFVLFFLSHREEFFLYARNLAVFRFVVFCIDTHAV
jgi:hypothetical protein